MTDDEKALKKALRDVRRTLAAEHHPTERIASALTQIDAAIGAPPITQITGKDIHNVYRSAYPDVLPWNAMTEKGQGLYNLTAAMIQARCLSPLQGLIREWRAWAKEAIDDPDVLFEALCAEEHAELLRRTAEMLGEEGES